MRDKGVRKGFAFGAVMSLFTPIGVLLVWQCFGDEFLMPILGIPAAFCLMAGTVGSFFVWQGVCILIYRALKAGDMQ